ncbi:protein NinF [Phytobacter ursingii]
MSTPDTYRQCEKDLVNAAGYCCGCEKRLTDAETYFCSICEKEIAAYRDPNGLMVEKDDE